MEENREYISEDTLNAGSEFLMHYGVKGMKWGKHKKISNPVIEGLGLGARVKTEWESVPLKWTAKDTAANNRGAAIRKRYETRDKAVKTIAKTGEKVTRKTRQTTVKELKGHKRTQVGSAVLKSLGNRYPKEAARRTGRTALYKGLNSNTKVRESFQKAERKRIDRRLAKQGSRTVRGQKLIAQKRLIKKLPNGKAKKAAMKKWTLNREAFYETL